MTLWLKGWEPHDRKSADSSNLPFLKLKLPPPSQALKMHIVALMHQRGVECRPEQVFLTTGAQQAMNLLARVLLETHGAVILEDKVYSGILQAIEPCLPTVYAVPTDPITGMDVDAVEQFPNDCGRSLPPDCGEQMY
jgi:DNA-binding transcriptional MocR family regulator